MPKPVPSSDGPLGIVCACPCAAAVQVHATAMGLQPHATSSVTLAHSYKVEQSLHARAIITSSGYVAAATYSCTQDITNCPSRYYFAVATSAIVTLGSWPRTTERTRCAVCMPEAEAETRSQWLCSTWNLDLTTS
eukprot:357749-Chlamydomonas_euryale.AAC.2